MTENNHTTALLNLSQTALTQALEELEEAKKTLEWAREKLAETQLDNRKLCNLLMKFSEAPDPKEFEALLKFLNLQATLLLQFHLPVEVPQAQICK